MRRMVRLTALALAACLVASCGEDATTVAAPLPVPTDLVPLTLEVDTLSIDEDDAARKAFTEIGSDSLIDDGRLWAIRRGEVLVATLQISTVKPSVDLTRSSDRAAIGSKIMPSGAPTIFVDDIEVQAIKVNDKSTYLWFGRDLFQVLQVKASAFSSEDLLTEIVEFQQTQASWHPLATDEEEILE